jgi:F-type H+-transporting ATPase subunit delta
MRGTSQESRDEVLRGFDPVASAAGKDGVALAAQLFTVVDALDGSGSLRRALTDPARPGKDKGELVDGLFSSLDSRARDVVRAFVAQRWSAEADLAESITEAGYAALLATAESTGKLDAVEEQLFRVERALTAERELLTALGDRSAPRASRVGLLKKVLGGKLEPVTDAILERAVAAPRGTRLITTIRHLVVMAAERRGRGVARVTAAVELSAAQRKRLAGILKAAYGREIQINVAVDPQVLGGIKVQVGSEVVDGTVLARLDDARRRLVG